VFEGIGGLAADLIVACSQTTRSLNENGVKKIQRNILALQQSLKTLHVGPKETDLEKAKRYWAMYFTTPQVLIHYFLGRSEQ
jgi:exocyst complex component 4